MILLQLVTCEVQEQTEPDRTQSLISVGYTVLYKLKTIIL